MRSNSCFLYFRLRACKLTSLIWINGKGKYLNNTFLSRKHGRLANRWNYLIVKCYVVAYCVVPEKKMEFYHKILPRNVLILTQDKQCTEQVTQLVWAFKHIKCFIEHCLHFDPRQWSKQISGKWSFSTHSRLRLATAIRP